ncbi:putative PAS/PAC sensor protein [Caldicellulosiruptor obsidiansis OB47]|uniref:Putative PAS/PAC sensor protein n=1 Tax=Caldicellulosiruptor obsidiansis (strain ATCC BAA-2073 / JCM 16842 / OB47) TaxID=608506 RepID=D9THS6_CALOO|nr:SpoIIE family protein phosphatase [Caldicellulosiruptor obsidiansis]ADL43551.1 putative PAS/PAC sensor protein [Caldicellulosiruptor obsidiansis OB47]
MENNKIEFTKSFYESILNGMLDLVRVIDIDGVVVFCNTKMKEEFGDQTGKKCYELFCKDSRCDDCIAVRAMRENTRFMKYAQHKDKFYYVISSPVHSEDGKVIGTVEVFRDITEQRKIEERLRRQNEFLKRDLEFAKRLQQSLLPVIPRIEGYRITYTYKPCERLGGDFLDVISIDDRIVFYVADVAGHGLLASMVTIFVKQSIIKNAHTYINSSAQEIMKGVLLDFIEMNFPNEIYITIVLGILEKQSGRVTMISAGHVTEPILVKANKKVKMFSMRGQPIASIDLEQGFEMKEVVLEKHDKLIFYSDGLIESKNKQGEMYGKKRLIKRILSIKNINTELLIRDVRNFVSDIDDDIAVLMIEKM